jgi:hypothetical protein
MVVLALPILAFSLCGANTIGPAIRASPTGAAQPTFKKSVKTSYWRYEFTPLCL